jgi:peptidoglycan/xylan/chitin deacetylase (PgdA/CDA1 family)
VNGKSATVPENDTLGAALKDLGIKPKPGRLLDVRGGVLQPAAFPAEILLNGEPARRQAKLSVGDSISIEAGSDQTEGTVERKARVSGDRQTNPQSYLGTAPGYEIVTEGQLSGKVASVTFHRTGHITSPKAIALSFDDGPNPKYTPQVLKVLRHFHVSATFFVIGYEAQKYPGLVRKEIARGNVVGTHSWSHPEHFASLDTSQLGKQFSQTDDVMTQIGVDPYLFRPPGGSYDAQVVEIARRYGMRTVLWSVSTNDWVASRTAKEITRSALSHAEPGAIVLMHDGGGDQSATVKALPDIIKGLRKRGYDLVAIPTDG